MVISQTAARTAARRCARRRSSWTTCSTTARASRPRAPPPQRTGYVSCQSFCFSAALCFCGADLGAGRWVGSDIRAIHCGAQDKFVGVSSSGEVCAVSKRAISQHGAERCCSVFCRRRAHRATLAFRAARSAAAAAAVAAAMVSCFLALRLDRCSFRSVVFFWCDRLGSAAAAQLADRGLASQRRRRCVCAHRTCSNDA